MKTGTQIKKDFDTVAFFRNVKEQIANQLQGKTFEEQKAILRKMKSGEIKLKPLETKDKNNDC
jgi:hypothetical protein